MSDYIKREDAIFIALQQPIYSLVSEIKQLKGIDLDDYVPREFHDKTCEAMAKRHQKEIADMVRVVRCKECKWATETRMKSIEGDVIYLKTCPSRTEVIDDNDFCSYGEREDE